MISKRLNKITDMIAPCGLLADIGCDHGYVPIRCVADHTAKAAIASDIAQGPLAAAADNIRAAGLSGSIRTVLADGLDGIAAEERPDCIVMAGIGGILMCRILGTLHPQKADPRFSALRQLVLGPQSDIDKVRHFLADELSFPIVREVTVLEDGKFYTLLDVRPGAVCAEAFSESEYMYGKHIDPETSDIYRAYLTQQKRILEDAYRGALKGCSYGAAEAIRDLRSRMSLVDEALQKQT